MIIILGIVNNVEKYKKEVEDDIINDSAILSLPFEKKVIARERVVNKIVKNSVSYWKLNHNESEKIEVSLIFTSKMADLIFSDAEMLSFEDEILFHLH